MIWRMQKYMKVLFALGGLFTLVSLLYTYIPAHVCHCPVSAPRSVPENLCSTPAPSLTTRNVIAEEKKRDEIPTSLKTIDETKFAGTRSELMVKPIDKETRKTNTEGTIIEEARITNEGTMRKDTTELTGKSSKRPFLCANRDGRFGNVIFLYASLFGIARHKNMTPMFYDLRNILYGVFKISAVRSMTPCPVTKHVKKNVQHCSFHEADIDFSNEKNATLYYHGYYQSWKYFQDSYDEIRREFQFVDEIQIAARDAFHGAVSSKFPSPVKNLTYVTMHVRRSDLLRNLHIITYGLTSPGLQYYVEAMNWYRDRYKPLVFIICADKISMVWSKEKLTAPDVVFANGNRAEVDLAIISMGDHTIMSVGTFGWWGSFLAGGNTIAYGNPTREGSPARRQFSHDYKDFFMPHWIIINGPAEKPDI